MFKKGLELSFVSYKLTIKGRIKIDPNKQTTNEHQRKNYVYFGANDLFIDSISTVLFANSGKRKRERVRDGT